MERLLVDGLYLIFPKKADLMMHPPRHINAIPP